MPKGVKIHLSQEELNWLKDNCKLVSSKYAEKFNNKFGRDLKAGTIHGIRKRHGWSTGRDGKFKKGNVPSPNAGPKGPNKTSFKKGHVPPNRVPLYSERISKDGYIEIKVPEVDRHTGRNTRFVLKHRWIWEKENGPVPDHHIVIFIDQDKTNCQLSNLEVVHRGVSAIMNKSGYGAADDQLKPTIKAIAKLQNKVAQISKADDKSSQP